MNPKKCHLVQPRVKLLGHVVLENGIEADPDKVKSIILLPSPKSSKQLATFIYKVKYMARFIPLLSQLLYPCSKWQSMILYNGMINVKRFFRV